MLSVGVVSPDDDSQTSTLKRVASDRRPTPYSREDSYTREDSNSKKDLSSGTRPPTPYPHRSSRNSDEFEVSAPKFDYTDDQPHVFKIRFASLPGPAEFFSYPAERDPTRSELYLETFEMICPCCCFLKHRRGHATELEADRPRILRGASEYDASKGAPPKSILKHTTLESTDSRGRAPTGIC